MKYIANWRLKLNGKAYEAGKILSLSADEAAPLVQNGVLSAVVEKDPAGAGAQADGSAKPEVSKMNKAQLAEFGAGLGLKLDAAAMTKDAMLAAIAEAQAKA